MVGLLLGISLAACGGDETSESDHDDVNADPGSDGDENGADGDDENNDENENDGDKKSVDSGTTKNADAGGKKNTDVSKGSETDGGAKEANSVVDGGSTVCDGIKIGARCAKKEHLTVVERQPQLSDDGNLVYDFDKKYENLAALRKDKPKIPPSADLGEWYLYNGDYVRGGVSFGSFTTAGGPIADKDRLPQREGRNKDLTWNLTAVKAQDNLTDLAAPNCTVCHYAYFEDKLIRGLGRNKHFIANDASGFTLDVPGIVLSTFIALDPLQTAVEGLGFLSHLFGEVSYSHLFDLFAGLGLKHDANTLKWTGVLDGDPNSGMVGWIDFPAWWNFKKKNALYANASGRGHLSNHLWYMNWFALEGIAEAEEVMNNFVHVQKFLEERIQPPKFEDFGGKINKELAAKGEQVFLESCSYCHGTYSENDADETFPNILVDIAEVGTHPKLATNHWAYPIEPWYKKSWYAKQDPETAIVRTNGYLAPPLDGIFISAPYLHNGSVPTLEQLIDPSKRLDVWTSNMSAGDYDYGTAGWMDKPLDLDVWTLDQNFGIYDTAEEGNSNKGHTYGAALNPEEKKQLLEYLKTL